MIQENIIVSLGLALVSFGKGKPGVVFRSSPTVIAYFAFGEEVDLMILVGAGVILFGSILVISRKSRFARFRDKVLRRKLRLLPMNQT